MKSWVWLSAALAITCTRVLVGSDVGPAAVKPRWVTGFYVGYMASAYPPSAIDFSSLTHVTVFSVLPQETGKLDTTLFTDGLNGPKIAREVAARAHAAGRTAILAIGGAGTEAGFKGATSPQHLSAFVRSVVDLTVEWGFDGVDIDWEPLPEADYPIVLTLITKLKAARPGLVITTDLGFRSRNFRLSAADASFYRQLSAIVDQMNMMTYGMADNWDGWVVWHSSALSGDGPDHPTSVHASVRDYVAAGVPAAKLGMGIAFYGACWSAPTTAPLQTPLGSHVVASDHEIGFAALKNLYYRKDRYHFDATAQVPYLSFAVPTGPKKCTFISYEDEASIAAKGQYAAAAGLGGTIVWQLNEGYAIGAPDPSSLLHAVGRAFGVSPAAGPSLPTVERK